jgi:Flp pilus assembly protein TadD
MLALCIASAILNARNTRFTHVIIMLAFAFLSMQSRRHMALFGLLSAPGLAYNLAGAKQLLAKRWMGIMRIGSTAGTVLISLFLCILILDVTDNSYYIRQRSLKRFGLGKSQIAFPDAAMDFIDSSHVDGRVFCNYDVGSYFAGRFYPRRQVFIDGRNLVYGEEFFRTYLDAMGDIAAFDALAERYGVSAALLTHSARDAKAILPALWKSSNWTPAYADARAVVFLRNRSGAPAPPRLDLSACDLPVMLEGDSFPIEGLRAGELFFTLGLKSCAKDRLRRALTRYPELPEAHNMLGLIAIQEGSTTKAIIEFKQACRMCRAYAEPRINLSAVLLGDGDVQGAMREAKEAVRIAPLNALAHSALGLACLYAGKPVKALGELEEAVRLDPGYATARKNLAALYEREGALDKARRHLEEVVRRMPSDKMAREMLQKINVMEANKSDAGAY